MKSVSLSGLLVLGLLLVGSTQFGCGKRPPAAPIVVAGEYQGRYRGGTETVSLSEDGTFKQRFLRDDKSVVYEGAGTWSFDGGSDIRLRPFIGYIDAGAANTEKFETNQIALAVFQLNPARIEIGEWPYVVTKTR